MGKKEPLRPKSSGIKQKIRNYDNISRKAQIITVEFAYPWMLYANIASVAQHRHALRRRSSWRQMWHVALILQIVFVTYKEIHIDGTVINIWWLHHLKTYLQIKSRLPQKNVNYGIYIFWLHSFITFEFSWCCQLLWDRKYIYIFIY